MVCYRSLAALLLALITGVVHAEAIVIDDFASDQGPIEDTTTDGIPVTNTLDGRTLSINLTASIAPVESALYTSSGFLSAEHNIGENAEIEVSWTLPPNPLPADAFNTAVLLEQVTNDLDLTIQFLLNGESVLTANVPGRTYDEDLSFTVEPEKFAAGGTLVMRITSSTASWDAKISSFAITYQRPPAMVPTSPLAMQVLMSLGLLAMGLRRVRRRISAT